MWWPQTKRGLLASLWTVVTICSTTAFFTSLIFTFAASQRNSGDYQDYQNNNEDERQEERQDGDQEIALTSRAMAFAALWTSVLATLLAIFGAVVLGWQSPTGPYYACCAPSVHKTTPLTLGSFIGALFMFANFTLVCAALFGEFEIRDYRDDYREGAEERAREEQKDRTTALSRSSMAFSILCIFLTVLYASFAALTFWYSREFLDELDRDKEDDRSRTPSHHHHLTSHPFGATQGTAYSNGYIGERFDVRRGSGNAPSGGGGFVVTPKPSEGGTMT